MASRDFRPRLSCRFPESVHFFPETGRVSRSAARLVRGKVPAWRARWRAGALAAAELTGAHLDALESGAPAYLSAADTYQTEPTQRGGYGMCGHRDTYRADSKSL